MPLLRPLHRRQQVERSRNSELTSLATDIVAGLRILRGIGGEQTFGANYDRQSRSARDAGVALLVGAEINADMAGRRKLRAAAAPPVTIAPSRRA